MSLDPSENPTCVHCGSTDLDDQLRAVFGVMCCTDCKKERPEMYSLLTKTECKEDYLLTERAPLTSPRWADYIPGRGASYLLMESYLAGPQPNCATRSSCRTSSARIRTARPTAT